MPSTVSPLYHIRSWEQMLLIAIPIVAVLGLLLTLGVSIYPSSRKCQRWKKTATVPLLRARASVSSKWTVASPNGGELYFAAFSIQDGQVLELSLSQITYQYLAEGDFGELSYQGSQFIQFLSCTDFEPGRREDSP